MSTVDVVKAWKDQEYRDSLTAEQLAQLPPHPAGLIEFGVPQLEDESLFGPTAGKCKFFSNNYTNKCYTYTSKCSTATPGHCK